MCRMMVAGAWVLTILLASPQAGVGAESGGEVGAE